MPMFVVHLLLLIWLVRMEILLYRIQRLGGDVALVEALLRCWAIEGNWSPKMKTELLELLARHDADVRRRKDLP